MTFEEWFESKWIRADSLRKFAEAAWNAALDEAAKVADREEFAKGQAHAWIEDEILALKTKREDS